MYTEELVSLYFQLNIISVVKRKMRWVGMQHAWEAENAYEFMVGNPEDERPLAIPRLRWEENIKMALNDERQKIWNRFTWMRLALVNEFSLS